jgi:hypothetical protein
LHDILRERRVVGDTERQSIGGAAVPVVQRSDRLLVATLNRPEKRRVVYFSRSASIAVAVQISLRRLIARL